MPNSFETRGWFGPYLMRFNLRFLVLITSQSGTWHSRGPYFDFDQNTIACSSHLGCGPATPFLSSFYFLQQDFSNY